MANINDADKKLVELMFSAIDHGINSVKDSSTPLIPFMITEHNKKKELKRFVSKNPEDGLIQARKYLRELKNQPEFAVIAFDGYLNMDNIKYNAVIVEGYDKNDSATYLVAQRYQQKKFLSKFKIIGNATFLGLAENEEKKQSQRFFCFIMYKNDNLHLDIAEQKLKEIGLTVERNNDVLRTFYKNGPSLFISHSYGQKILQESIRIGTASAYEKQLKESNSRFEIFFDNIEEVLDEINTLIEVQSTLQNITGGVIFNNWNQSLSME